MGLDLLRSGAQSSGLVTRKELSGGFVHKLRLLGVDTYDHLAWLHPIDLHAHGVDDDLIDDVAWALNERHIRRPAGPLREIYAIGDLDLGTADLILLLKHNLQTPAAVGNWLRQHEKLLLSQVHDRMNHTRPVSPAAVAKTLGRIRHAYRQHQTYNDDKRVGLATLVYELAQRGEPGIPPRPIVLSEVLENLKNGGLVLPASPAGEVGVLLHRNVAIVFGTLNPQETYRIYADNEPGVGPRVYFRSLKTGETLGYDLDRARGSWRIDPHVALKRIAMDLQVRAPDLEAARTWFHRNIARDATPPGRSLSEMPWAYATRAYDAAHGIGTVIKKPTLNLEESGTYANERVLVEYTVRQGRGRTHVLEWRSSRDIQPVASLEEISILGGIPLQKLMLARKKGMLPESIPRFPNIFSWEQVTAILDAFILREPREDYFDVNELARDLRRLPAWPYGMIRLKTLTPDQSIWTDNLIGKRPYFFRRHLESLRWRFDPMRYPHTYRMDELSSKLEVSRRSLDAVVDKAPVIPPASGAEPRPKRIVIGTIEIEVIGTDDRPVYIVSPKKMQQLKRYLHAKPTHIYIRTAADELDITSTQLKRRARDAGIEIHDDGVRRFRGTRQSISLDDFEQIKNSMPASRTALHISRYKLATERLGVREKTLRRLKSHFTITRGKRKHHYYYEDRLPLYLQSREAFRVWLSRQHEKEREKAKQRRMTKRSA